MASTIKVVHIITGLNIGGAEQALKRLVTADADGRNTHIIISLTGSGTFGIELQSLGYKVHFLDFKKLFLFPRSFLRLVKIIGEYKPDITQTWMYHANLIGGLAAYCAGQRRIIWGIRTSLVPKKRIKTYAVMKLCAVLSYFVPKKIICVGQATKHNHCSYGYKEQIMCVIGNGFDCTVYNAQQYDKLTIRNQIGLKPDDFVIGCIGRYHPDKGQDLFLQAIALVNKASNKTVRYLLVGRHCDEANKELLQLIDSLELRSSVVLLGERNDIPQCLAALDVYCLPSRQEGFPNALGEAMAMGLACVATQVGDVRLLVDDTVLVAAPADVRALALALSEMMSKTTEERQALGQKASERITHNFSHDKTRASFYKVYQDILETPI